MSIITITEVPQSYNKNYEIKIIHDEKRECNICTCIGGTFLYIDSFKNMPMPLLLCENCIIEWFAIHRGEL